MRDDTKRLHDILDAIEQIEKYADRGRDAFVKEELIQIWMLYHLQIIGEAVAKISDDIRNKHSEIPWAQIVAM